jgi:hypothetical protein
LDVGLVESTKYTIRGKVVASLKSRPGWILWIRVCSWLILAPKVFKLWTNQLVVGLCRFVWVIKCLLFFLVPFRSSNMPFYPQSVASQGTCFDSVFFRCFHFMFAFKSIKELGTTSHGIGRYVWG